MSEAYVITGSYLAVQPGQPRADAAAAVLQNLLISAGILAGRISEIHWQAPPRAAAQDDAQRAQEYDIDTLGPWLIQLTQRLSFAPDLAAFLWPAAPLLDHYILQSAARSIQSGQRDLVLVGQFSAARTPGGGLEQAAGLLLASPAAVGRYNLAPRARLAAMLAINAGEGGLLAAGSSSLQRLAERERMARQPLSSQGGAAAGPYILPHPDELDGLAAHNSANEPIEPERFDLPTPAEVHWLASAAPLGSMADSFPGAHWLEDVPPAPGAALLLTALMSTLETSSTDWAALFSSGPQETGLMTLIERI